MTRMRHGRRHSDLSDSRVSYRNEQGKIIYFAEPSGRLLFRGCLPLIPRNMKERIDAMSKKEKGMYFQCNQKQWDQIRKQAKASGLKQGEYILQRALGAAPKETQLGAYLNLYRKLCEITNRDMSAETESRLLDVLDQIYNRLFEGAPPSEEVLLEEKQALEDYYADIGDD